MAESKLQLLLDAYQSNMYPAMGEALAKQLGVSPDSIRRLGIGFAPVVEFKKGKNFQGWWAVPERDSEAKVLGLSLRSQDGSAKPMLPGTHHGIIYEVNPEHQAGEKGYSGGSHNWIRTMDAGIPCPVCGKPDGCLLSAECPADPKAVVCIREQSPRKLRMGFLHIRKVEGQLTGRAALPDNGGPVVVVEGMSDCAAAMDLGFNAVGRPSNLACMDMLCDLVRARPVIVLGENDKKEDGKEPGREGMIAAFQTIRKVCQNVVMLMPPAHIKDLRAWVVKYGLTRDVFLAAVEKDGQKKVDGSVLLDARPTTIARAYLDQNFRMAGRYILRQWEDGWYEYKNGKYISRKEAEVIQPLYQWGYDKLVQIEGPKGEVKLQAFKVDPYMTTSLRQAIMSEVLIAARQLPCWINGAEGPDARDLIVFSNGILHVPAFLEGRPEKIYWRDKTPDLFSLSALPTAFDPTGKCPVWEATLESSIGEEVEKIELLREWFGYCMTSDTSMQKMMFLRGVSGSGKGTILRVLHQLVGEGQAASTSFADLSEPFGLSPLIGKLICTIGDARTPKHGKEVRGLELLLNITGGDEVQINRKFKDQLEGQQITARITMASNSFLEVTDHEGALARRLNLIEFTKTFKDAPDTNLDRKLAAEVPGIVVWALSGLKRLRDNGAFTVPPSSVLALEEIKTDLSPVASFAEECCEQFGEVNKRELYDAWVKWSTERRLFQMSQSRFAERLRTNCPYSSTATYEEGVHKRSMFTGISLKRWAARQYLGRTE